MNITHLQIGIDDKQSLGVYYAKWVRLNPT